MSSNSLHKMAAAKGFTEQEINALKNFSKIMASQVMKKFLIKCIEEAGERLGINEFERSKNVPEEKKEIHGVYKRAMANVLRLESENYTGYQELEFAHENETYKMRMQISLVPKNYEFEVRIPEGKERAFFMHLDKLIQIAMQYYHVYAEKLVKDLAVLFPDDNVASLGLNPKNRTLCLSESGNVRIGVLCFYVDANGNPLV